MADDTRMKRDEWQRGYPGCSDGGCVWGHPGGMHTNGGCRCLDLWGDCDLGGRVPLEARRKIQGGVRDLRTALAKARARIEELERAIARQRDRHVLGAVEATSRAEMRERCLVASVLDELLPEQLRRSDIDGPPVEPAR